MASREQHLGNASRSFRVAADLHRYVAEHHDRATDDAEAALERAAAAERAAEQAEAMLRDTR